MSNVRLDATDVQRTKIGSGTACAKGRCNGFQLDGVLGQVNKTLRMKS